MTDNWLDKSSFKCETCMWYVSKKSVAGRCRRHAPTMNGYPVVYSSDWCGDHKIDHMKLAATDTVAECDRSDKK